MARDRLVKLRLGLGGAPIPIVPVNSFWGADWGDDGWIVVSDLQGRRVFRVNAETGVQEELPSATGMPSVVPGSRATLLGSRESSLHIPSRREGKVLAITGSDLRYLPTGHITYVDQGALWTVPFGVTARRTRSPRGTPPLAASRTPTPAPGGSVPRAPLAETPRPAR